MAQLPVINNVSRVVFRWNRLDACNVMHFKQGSVDPSGLFGALDANVQSNMWAHTTQAIRVQLVEITPLDGDSPTELFVPDDVAKWKGGVLSSDIIPSLCPVVSLRTGHRGRNYRGRVYLPFCAETANADGLLPTSYLTLLNTGWSSFVNGLQADAVDMHVASYVKGTSAAVTNLVLRNEMGTQRRRQQRVA